jgi:hypothetical protein
MLAVTSATNNYIFLVFANVLLGRFLCGKGFLMQTWSQPVGSIGRPSLGTAPP